MIIGSGVIMTLCFTLSMPSVNSWNGKWSGAERLYAKVINFGKTKKSNENAQFILNKECFYYNFGDGWSACVTVKEVDSKEAATVRKKSDGFCGYDWMIDSIIDIGEIKPRIR
jgi:hypothetical protein